MGRRRTYYREVRRLSLVSPPAMVASVGRRRAAGDWRGACTAGMVDAHVDLPDVARRWGPGEAERIEAELRGFAPDLLRRFLPRLDSWALASRQQVVLSRLNVPFPARSGNAAVLVVSQPTEARAPQRLGLRVVDAAEVGDGWLDLPDWCWHADASTDRRWAYGASPERLPWHHPDGRPYAPDETSPPERPADRAEMVEALTALLAAGDVPAAYRAAGFAVDHTPPRYGSAHLVTHQLTRSSPTLPLLAAEYRRLAHRYGHRSLRFASQLAVTEDDGVLRLHAHPSAYKLPGPLVGVPAPSDVALLLAGALSAGELHPLVHEALFPGRDQHRPATRPETGKEFRVRCGGDWHLLRSTGGHLSTGHHDAAEIERELLLARLGGPITGCANAVRAWRTGGKAVPKEIRRVRADLLARLFHGDTDTVLAFVAAGLDPELRDGTGGTLLHWLSHLDHVRALPALLAAGLSLDARDGEGDTPLHRAAAAGAEDVMAALVDAGADRRAVNGANRTPARVLQEARRRG
ncbi:ankyrin repeat domain-containing protein [Micromonospora sp. 15K316]|uniref:ankyrin repeat domain-containing protein n=1 Tax=Micromonospora sp. 15K316 TaxID=2530376 RepID=UPI00104EFF92|nr:ankyrin repeat domain-containing protein [Micromonospora sp. 15K316]TDC37877.1 ankyrin repeat domain-containing protein [Micromonospora sp. 15K316]